MFRRLSLAYLILLLAIVIQLRLLAVLGVSPDLILAAIFVFALVLDLWELLPVALFGAWILNWQPVIGQESIYLLSLPIFAFMLKKAVPWQPWLGAAAYALGGTFLFYLFSGHSAWRAVSPIFLLLDGAVILLFGWTVLLLLRPPQRPVKQMLF